MAKGPANPPKGNPEHSLDRHPLLIAVISLAIGGFGLSCVQNRSAEKKALLDKRYAVAGDLAAYASQAASTLRILESFKKAVDAKDLSRSENNQMQSDVQRHINITGEMQNRLEVNLALYFSNGRPLAAFQILRDAYRESLNQGMIAAEAGKPWGPDFQALSFHADNCICSLKGDLPIKDIGAGKCH